MNRSLWLLAAAALLSCGRVIIDPTPKPPPPVEEPDVEEPSVPAPEPRPTSDAGIPCGKTQDCPENRLLVECHQSICLDGWCAVLPSAEIQWCNDAMGFCTGALGGEPACVKPTGCADDGCRFLYCDEYAWCQWEPEAEDKPCPGGSCQQGMCCPPQP